MDRCYIRAYLVVGVVNISVQLLKKWVFNFFVPKNINNWLSTTICSNHQKHPIQQNTTCWLSV